MKLFKTRAALAFAALILPVAAMAQDAKPAESPAPAASENTAPNPIPGTPNLTVATVKVEDGTRASKIIGAAVNNSGNQPVGTVDDLILDHDNKVTLAVISVGGVLGVGGKLVAVPFTDLHMDGTGKVLMPNASKDSLSKMPGFTYGP